MRALALVLVLSALAVPALAQSTEDKLRDALRRSTVDLRALQDQQGQLQAERDAAVKQRDLLQQQLTDANAKLAEAAQAQAPPPKQEDPEQIKKLEALLEEARKELAGLAASNAKWQAAYQQAAALAQQKDAEAKRLGQGLSAAQKENTLNHATNQKLAGLAGDILHLYQTQDFRGILLRSYEPVLGLGKVKLDNTVQDYEDKIADLRIYQGAAPRP